MEIIEKLFSKMIIVYSFFVIGHSKSKYYYFLLLKNFVLFFKIKFFLKNNNFSLFKFLKNKNLLIFSLDIIFI